MAMLCAQGVGCITPAPSVQGPLTPYSALYSAQNAAAIASADPASHGAAPAVPGSHPTSTAASPADPGAASGDPYRYSPASVDPDLLDDSDEKRSLWDRVTSYSPKKSFNAFKERIGLGPDEALARQLYTDADHLFRDKQYAEAAKKYKQAGKRWPDSQLQEDALFMAAECYFQIDRYPRASDTYTVLLKKYDNSRHLDMIVKRRFAIGRYWEQRGKDRAMMAFNFTDKTIPFWDVTGNTVAVYESIRMDDPTGPLADDATMATATTYFLKGRYEDAAYHYDLMRTEFPQSEFQPQAHLLGMQAKLLSYQGPQYDGKPLDEAKKLASSIQTQFAGQLPKKELDNVAQTMKAIDAQIAERDWSTGEFYYNTKHYGAARYYYDQVVKDHPQSRFADLARARIDQVKDKPPEPANEVEWLASKFRRASPKPASPAPAAGPQAVPQDQPAIVRQPQDQR